VVSVLFLRPERPEGYRRATVNMRNLHWFNLAFALLLLPLLFGGAGCGSDGTGAEWPARKSIYVAVFAPPGGSTDLANRAMAKAMERELGASFSVLNMPGAQGGVAASYVWNAARDGHAWFGMSEGSLGLAVLGAHTTTARDWHYFVISGTPGVLSVPPDSPYSTAEELLAGIRARPNQIRMASAFPGTVWHIQYLALVRAGDLKIRWISYPGSHPSQVAALSGEVDVVLSGLGEQVELLRSGKLKPLAVTQTEPYNLEGVGRIPPITAALPQMEQHLPLQQFIGFALPEGTPPEILAKIEAAFLQAMTSDEVRRFAENSHSDLFGYYGDEAAAVFREREKMLSWLLYDEGLAAHSPEKFGIERP
jgi:tripartite-type tricarboxylate transporter receptor subunit TctC